MTVYINPVIGILILVLIGLVVLYLQGRVKNLATKHDVGELTRITEEAKINFTKQTEELKAQLTLSNQHKLGVKVDERAALIDFNKRATEWLYSIMRVSSSGYNIKNYSSFNEVEKMLNEKQVNYDIADSHLYLFYNDNDFVKAHSELSKKLVAMDNLASKFIEDIMRIYGSYSIKIANLKSEEIAPEYTKMYEEIRGVLDSFYKTRGEMFAEAHKIFTSVQKLIQKRMKEIEE